MLLPSNIHKIRIFPKLLISSIQERYNPTNLMLIWIIQMKYARGVQFLEFTFSNPLILVFSAISSSVFVISRHWRST